MTKLLEAGTYEYEVQCDGLELKAGDKFTIRRQSEKERERFLHEDSILLMQELEDCGMNAYSGKMSTKDRNRIFDEAQALAKRFCTGEDRIRIRHFKEFAHIIDLLGFIQRIIIVESALHEGNKIPEQQKLIDLEEIEQADEKQLSAAEEEARGLGESSPRSELATITTPSSSPAESSSSGSDPVTAVIESEVSETSR